MFLLHYHITKSFDHYHLRSIWNLFCFMLYTPRWLLGSIKGTSILFPFVGSTFHQISFLITFIQTECWRLSFFGDFKQNSCGEVFSAPLSPPSGWDFRDSFRRRVCGQWQGVQRGFFRHPCRSPNLPARRSTLNRSPFPRQQFVDDEFAVKNFILENIH